MGPSDPQLGGWLMPVIAAAYLAAALTVFGWGCHGLYRWYRAWRPRQPRHDDGQPADVATTLASIDTMKQQGRL